MIYGHFGMSSFKQTIDIFLKNPTNPYLSFEKQSAVRHSHHKQDFLLGMLLFLNWLLCLPKLKLSPLSHTRPFNSPSLHKRSCNNTHTVDSVVSFSINPFRYILFQLFVIDTQQSIYKYHC